MTQRYGLWKTLTFFSLALAGAILGGAATIAVFVFTWNTIGLLFGGAANSVDVVGALFGVVCTLGLACSTLVLVVFMVRFMNGPKIK